MVVAAAIGLARIGLTQQGAGHAGSGVLLPRPTQRLGPSERRLLAVNTSPVGPSGTLAARQ